MKNRFRVMVVPSKKYACAGSRAAFVRLWQSYWDIFELDHSVRIDVDEVSFNDDPQERLYRPDKEYDLLVADCGPSDFMDLANMITQNQVVLQKKVVVWTGPSWQNLEFWPGLNKATQLCARHEERIESTLSEMLGLSKEE